MSCTLCTTAIEKSGNVRPNIATFECGHEFHLSCIIDYCKTRYTNLCPSCKPITMSSHLPNFNTDRLLALDTLVAARRKNREIKPNVSYLGGISSWFGSKKVTIKNLIANGTSLSTMKIQGYLPEDFTERQISWKHLSNIYTVDALLEFGFQWHHMILMGFSPEDFKKFSWEQMYDTLNIRASDMLKTSISCRQLSELKFTIQQIKQLNFNWNDLVRMDGNVKTLRLLTNNLSDLKTYFNPSVADWEKAGFSSERIKLYKWQTEEFTPVRQKRALTVQSLNKISF